MHIASVFLGVTYFMPALDTQIIEEEYKEMLRGVEHLPSSFCWRSRNEEIDGWIIERSPFPVKNREETASGHAGYPVKSSVSSSKYA